MKNAAYPVWICAVLAVAGCGSATPSVAGASPEFLPVPGAKSSSPIRHIVLVIQENRTFNNLFATFPGATGTTTGKERVKGVTRTINLKEARLTDRLNINHSYLAFLKAYDGGQMDGFNRIGFPLSGRSENAAPYQYVNEADIIPYWTMAKRYALANAMFTTQGSESFSAHQDLIRGGTGIDANDSLINNLPYTGQAWGCDSPPGSKTAIITTHLELENKAGPFPCTSSFPSSGSTYLTLRDLMDGQLPPVSWKYYTPAIGDAGGVWSAFDVIYPVRYGPEWSTNVSSPETNIFNDVASGSLAAMSWVVPDGIDSDHPGNGSDAGPSWVAGVVNAIGESQYWRSTAIIVVWDDWGGFYDPVAPPLPRDQQGGPGLRVPMIVISPYSREKSSGKPGYISRETFEFGSIIRFIEDTFDLGRLGTTDETTSSIGPENGSRSGDMFDFNQRPRRFRTIGTKYSRSYLLHRKASGIPPDTE